VSCFHFSVVFSTFISGFWVYYRPRPIYRLRMDMGYPPHFLAKLYRKQLAKVKVVGTLSEWFRVKKGVRQGCVLSSYLFNILAEMVMRETWIIDFKVDYKLDGE